MRAGTSGEHPPGADPVARQKLVPRQKPSHAEPRAGKGTRPHGQGPTREQRREAWERRREAWERRREAWDRQQPGDPPWGRPPWARGADAARRRPPSGVLAVVIAAIQVIGSTAAMHGQPEAVPLDAWGYVLLAAPAAALLARRRWPLPTLAITLAAAAGYLVLDYPRGPFFLAALVALFTAVRRSYRPAVWALCALAYAAYVLAGTASVSQYVVVGAWTTVAVALAEAARVRGEHFAEVTRARAEAARARQEQSRRQASDERLRIARELHDVLGHHLSLINVRAGVGLHLLDSDPAQAREALGAIKLASAEALQEVRNVLSALNPQPQDAPRSPAPGLGDLDALADETRAAGLSVTVRRPDSGPVRVPGDVDRAAYRIIQEALTNVRRHAGAAAAVTVTMGYEPGALTVRVDDTGPGPAQSTSEGNGIPGMRERAMALGGTLSAGRGPDGGFRVDARLPLAQEKT